MMRWLGPMMLLFATSCTAGQGAPCPDPCAGWAAIRPTVADTDVMSIGLARMILAHDQHGTGLCGWQP
jgi:hypothetical protein